MKWFGFMCTTKRLKLDTAISDKPVEYSRMPSYIEWHERDILVDALSEWLNRARFYYDRPEHVLRLVPEAKPDSYDPPCFYIPPVKENSTHLKETPRENGRRNSAALASATHGQVS